MRPMTVAPISDMPASSLTGIFLAIARAKRLTAPTKPGR